MQTVRECRKIFSKFVGQGKSMTIKLIKSEGYTVPRTFGTDGTKNLGTRGTRGTLGTPGTRGTPGTVGINLDLSMI